MANVEFNDESRTSALYNQQTEKNPFFVELLMKFGVKTPEAANGILLTITVIAFLLAVIIIFKTNSGAGRGLNSGPLKPGNDGRPTTLISR